MREPSSHYLKHSDRLADIISAIQVMGTYKYSARNIENWKKLLGNKPLSADNWTHIFVDHPEFFRSDIEESELHTLAIRRAQSRTYDTKTLSEITPKEFMDLPEGNRSHISRKPLSPDQILSLIEVAIKLHSQALERKKELRWWIPISLTIISSLTGAMIGAFFGVK